jgi:hypothetical protein
MFLTMQPPRAKGPVAAVPHWAAPGVTAADAPAHGGRPRLARTPPPCPQLPRGSCCARAQPPPLNPQTLWSHRSYTEGRPRAAPTRRLPPAPAPAAAAPAAATAATAAATAAAAAATSRHAAAAAAPRPPPVQHVLELPQRRRPAPRRQRAHLLRALAPEPAILDHLQVPLDRDLVGVRGEGVIGGSAVSAGARGRERAGGGRVRSRPLAARARARRAGAPGTRAAAARCPAARGAGS